MKDNILDGAFVTETCKKGATAECCRYLTTGKGGDKCVKSNAEVKKVIDTRCDEDIAIARGDNCPGKDEKIAE